MNSSKPASATTGGAGSGARCSCAPRARANVQRQLRALPLQAFAIAERASSKAKVGRDRGGR
jgi:hypothetical protein